LSGTNTGFRAVRGLRFELVADGMYRLVTRLGAAVDEAENGLRPHRFLITDRSGAKLSLGSASMRGETITQGETVFLSQGRNTLKLALEKAGLFQFDLDYKAKTLVVRRLQ